MPGKGTQDLEVKTRLYTPVAKFNFLLSIPLKIIPGYIPMYWKF